MPKQISYASNRLRCFTHITMSFIFGFKLSICSESRGSSA
uniref:Uncharacterized protein n=1 Tax=Arundo donax TaxID=35708 RepID=A0A0A9BEP2_ARUDO